jgi:hypothetical protein
VLLLVPVGLALALLAFALPRAAAGASGVHQRWRWPVDSRTLAGRFAYSPRHPFATAQRRGIDIVAAPGAAVRSACGGRVAFAGPVPGGGLGVTVRCGALVATHLGLARVAVRRGARVAPGTRLGAVGRGGRLRLGARVRGERFGYVDPLRFLHATPPPPAGPPPPRTRRRPNGPTPTQASPIARPVDAPAKRPVPTPATRLVPAVATPPVPVPGPATRPASPSQSRPLAPWPAWAALAALLLAAGGGVRVRRRRHAAKGASAASVVAGGVR